MLLRPGDAMSIQVSIVIPTVDEKAVREVLHQICQCCSSADLAEILLVTSNAIAKKVTGSGIW